MKRHLPFLTCAVAVLFTGCALPPTPPSTPNAPDPAPPTEKSPEPSPRDSTAPPLDGLSWIKRGPVPLETGHIYVIEFWATWSNPCLNAIPHLTKLQRTYADRGVRIVGITTESDVAKVESFVMEQGSAMGYAIAIDSSGTLFEHYMEAFDRKGIPTAFVVDAQRRIVWIGHPHADLDEVLAQVVDGSFNPEAYARARDERIATERALRERYRTYLDALLAGKSIEETRPLAEAYMSAAPANGLNALAWQIITMENVPESSRDYETALRAATQANEAAGGENPMILDTYALALSRSGRLKEALEAQRKAVELAVDNDRLQAEMTERLRRMEDALKTQPEQP